MKKSPLVDIREKSKEMLKVEWLPIIFFLLVGYLLASRGDTFSIIVSIPFFLGSFTNLLKPMLYRTVQKMAPAIGLKDELAEEGDLQLECTEAEGIRFVFHQFPFKGSFALEPEDAVDIARRLNYYADIIIARKAHEEKTAPTTETETPAAEAKSGFGLD